MDVFGFSQSELLNRMIRRLGEAEAVTVFAEYAGVADAVATATCNLVRSKSDLKTGIDFAKKISHIFGVVIILGDNLATWGDIEIKNFHKAADRR